MLTMEEFGRQRSLSKRGAVPAVAWKDREKSHHLGVAGAPVEIRIEDLPNT
jgi:hypothetical protein